jgi:hypothetical protein
VCFEKLFNADKAIVFVSGAQPRFRHASLRGCIMNKALIG